MKKKDQSLRAAWESTLVLLEPYNIYMVLRRFQTKRYVNPFVTELFNLNFQSPEVVSRYRDTQLHVTENLCYLRNLSPNIYQCFKIEGIYYCE